MEVILAKGFDMIVTVVLGLISWFVTDAVKTLKKDIGENKGALEKVKQDLNDLKADLPMVYVLREDFIRVMNNVDSKLDKLISNKIRGEDN